MYYIYHVKGVKIGVSENPKKRLLSQKVKDYEILEEHTDIYKVSDREQELQKQYGYPVDKNPYWKMHKIAKKGIGGKVAAGKGGRNNSSENKSKAGKAKRQITYTDAQQIRAEYGLGSITQTQLAKMYGVSKHIIYYIIHNKTYVTP